MGLTTRTIRCVAVVIALGIANANLDRSVVCQTSVTPHATMVSTATLREEVN